MKEILLDNGELLTTYDSITPRHKIHVITTEGKEFRISFADNNILIKEVSGEDITINPTACNSIRIS